MLLTVVRVYQQGRKLSEAELRSAVRVVGDVRSQVVQIEERAVRQAVCMDGTKQSLPPLIEPQLTGISPLKQNQIAVLQRVTTETRLK